MARAACRIHALLMELEPGGIAKRMNLTRANALLDRVVVDTEMAAHRVGVVTAAMIIGHVGDVSRFKSAAHFASHNGTARSKHHRVNADGIGSTRAGTGS